MKAERESALDRIILRRKDVLAALIGLLDKQNPRADRVPAPASYFYVTPAGIVWGGSAFPLSGVPSDVIARFHVAPSAKLSDADISFGRRHNVPVGVIGDGGLLTFAPRTWKPLEVADNE